MRAPLSVIGVHVLVLAACPQAEISSIDGLAGGKVTSAVEAPAVTTTELTATQATLETATAVTLNAETIVATSIDGERIATETLNVRGLPMFGLPLGVVDYTVPPNQDAGYRHADAACRTEFNSEAAHVCSADEVLGAFRAGFQLDSAFNGAAVNTHAFQVVADIQSDPSKLLVANDCDGWTSRNAGGDIRIEDPNALNDNRSNLGVRDVRRWVDAHMALFQGGSFHTGDWRLRPNIDDCAEVRLACCG